MTSGWSKEWPKRNGVFWCYWLSTMRQRMGSSPELTLVKVQGPTGNKGWLYVTEGRIMYGDEVAFALWMPAQLPRVPTLRELEDAKGGKS